MGRGNVADPSRTTVSDGKGASWPVGNVALSGIGRLPPLPGERQSSPCPHLYIIFQF